LQQVEQEALHEGKKKGKEAKLIEKALNFEDQKKFQQTNISDFFFSGGGGGNGSTVNTSVTLGELTETQMNTQAEPIHTQQAGTVFEFEADDIDYDLPPKPPLASENINLI
jgi:hypothetical protein